VILITKLNFKNFRITPGSPSTGVWLSELRLPVRGGRAGEDKGQEGKGRKG